VDIKTIELKIRKDFNIAICLMGIIPFIVCFYLLSNRAPAFNMVAGQTGYVLFITIIILLLGVATGRRMLWSLFKRLFDFNETILTLQDELVEKNRLSAVTETVLALGHEVNNPLLIIRGNIDLLEQDISTGKPPYAVKEKISIIKSHLERIRTVTEELSKLKHPVSTEIYGGSKMVDLEQST
jgi:signal transduction histidine kinase